MFVSEASNSVADSSVCCFSSEGLVRNRIALCMGKGDNRIAIFAVHCREVLQKDGQQKLQNNCRLPRATCTYEQTCTLLPLVDGDLSDLFVKCNIESISEPSANGSLLLGQCEASLLWVRMICRGFKLSGCS